MPNSSPALAGQLQNWFRTWLNRLPGEEEESLLYELIADGPASLVDQLSPNELQQWIRAWNKRFILSLGQELPRERFLCAFTAVEDTIYRLDQAELGHFVRWAAAELKLSVPEFTHQAATRARTGKNGQNRSLTDESVDLVDLLAALLWAWQPGRAGLRPAMMDSALREQLNTYITARKQANPHSVITLLGGAAGNMAGVLHGLGLRVGVYWTYHAPDLAALCPQSLGRLALEGNKTRFYPENSGDPTHPKRRSVIFSYAPGLQTEPEIEAETGKPESGFKTEPQTFDRQIYRYPFFVRPERGWSKMVLAAPSGQQVPILDPDDRLLRGEGWPFLPLFGEWRESGDTFTFTVADDAQIQQIARRFDYILLSGLQALGDPLLNLKNAAGQEINEPARHFIQQAMRRHLSLLARYGVRLHMEISGLYNPPVARLVRDAIQGSVKSAGINQEELAQITGSGTFRGSPFFLAARRENETGPTGFVRRYERALHLAQAFNLDQLYVHGNDADLILVRGLPRGAVRQALLANLFAKGVVVLALLRRSQSDWQKEAARMGIVLKKDGFLALLAMADAIAQDTFLVHPDDRETILRQFAFNGYWYNRDPKGYSVVVVPVMWPDLPPGLSTVGAGDAVSATFTALSLL